MLPVPQHAPGDTYKAFRFTKVFPVEELQAVLYELEDAETGASVMHIASDDRENLFCISFPTLPTDSSGVAHILEHTVLCGSEKFPVKDPFFSMRRRSLHTFMNALTGSDFTCYPAASQVKKDFYNLLSVYADAVLHPNLKELSFKQEGCRLEFDIPDDPTTPLLFKGVVFNEMKGNLSSPECRLRHAIMHELTPDLTYAHNVGGEPVAIRCLTHGELRAFHETFYHPSHALFFFYGSFPLLPHLDFLRDRVLVGYAKRDRIPPIPDQPRFGKPRAVEVAYPLGDKETQGKTFIAFSWLTASAEHSEELLALSVIDAVLMEHDASPLKAALLESKKCARVSGQLDAEVREVPYIIVCRGTDPEEADSLEAIVFETLRKLVREGIDCDLLDAAIHGLEFERLEITSDFGPFGLTLFVRAAIAKQYGCAPEETLTVREQFRNLREKSRNPDYFTGLIKRFFLDNPHFVRLIMKPSEALETEEAREEKQALATIRKALSEEEEGDLVRRAQELKAYQDLPEKEALEVLPKVTLADVPKEAVSFPLRKHSPANFSLYHHACHTNHIVYADLFFPVPALSMEELPYVKLLITLLPQLGTGARGYKENLEYISRYLGDFGASIHLIPDPDHLEKPLKPLFSLYGKALTRHVDKLFSLLKEGASSLRLDEGERIKNLILQIRTAGQNNLSRNALSYATCQALSGYRSGPYILQKWHGIDYFNFIKRLARDIDTGLPDLLKRLRALCSRLLHLNDPTLVIGSDVKQFDTISKEGYYGLGEPATRPYEAWQPLTPTEMPPSQGRFISTPVAFSAWGFDTPYTFAHSNARALSVLPYLLENTSLHRRIREQGGAYGSGACYGALQGTFHFYGYRDPHIAATYEAFSDGVRQIVEGRFDEKELEEAKLGLMQSLDTPVLPGRRALTAYLEMREGYTRERRQALREGALALTREEVRRVADTVLYSQTDRAVAVTVAGRSLIEREKGKLPFPLEVSPLEE